jgi:hypothetical protein
LYGDSVAGYDGTAAAGADVDSGSLHQVYLYLPPRALLVLGGEARYCW